MKPKFYESLNKISRIALTMLVVAVGADVILYFAYRLFAENIWNFFKTNPDFSTDSYFQLFNLLSLVFLILTVIGLVFGIIGAIYTIKEKKQLANSIWKWSLFGLFLILFLWMLFVSRHF